MSTKDAWETLEQIANEMETSPNLRRTLEAHAVAGWVETLGKWDCFFTGSFDTCWSELHASRAFERWHRRNQKSRSAFYVVEQHPGGHGAHIHALLASQGAYRRILWRTWFERYGRCRIEPIRKQLHLAAYCFKVNLTGYRMGGEMTKQFRDGVWWNVLNVRRRENLTAVGELSAGGGGLGSSAQPPLSTEAVNARFMAIASCCHEGQTLKVNE